MQKASFLILTILILSSCVVCSFNRVAALDLSSPDCGFGFQNGSYIYFRDPISVSVEQIASSNTTYGDWVFIQQDGSNERFGFYSTGVNVTVNSFFTSDILELNCVGVGTVRVQVASRSAPVSVSGTSALFDQTNRVAVVDVTSSVVVQLNWNVNPDPTPPPGGGGGGGGGDATPAPTVINPSGVGEKFKVSNINLGEIQPNSTITATLHFTFSGSSINLQSINLPEPFRSWYVPSENFTSVVYILSASGQSEGTASLTFNVPNVSEMSYSGSFVVTAKDAFGATLTSTATISAGSAIVEHTGLIGWIMANPLLLVLGIVALVAFVFYLLLKKR